MIQIHSQTYLSKEISVGVREYLWAENIISMPDVNENMIEREQNITWCNYKYEEKC